MKAGLLCNPLSGRIRKHQSAWMNEFTGAGQHLYREASEPEAIGRALDALLAEDIDLLAVAGGDGTVQAALTHLFTAHGETEWPLLTVIPAGTTNMTAMDLGIRGGPKRVLQRLARRLREQSLPTTGVARPVLRIERTGQADLYGMFFGAGSIAGGVRYFRDSIRHWGLTSEWAGGLAMFWMLGRLLLSPSSAALQPVAATVSGPGNRREEGAYLVILASALDRLLLGTRPYWGREQAPIHVTLLQASPDRFWRSLPSLLFGRGGRLTGRRGYDSFNTESLELLLGDDFIVDGELHRTTDSDRVLRISAVGPVNFFVP